MNRDTTNASVPGSHNGRCNVPSVSIIIATRNRADVLGECLEHLFKALEDWPAQTQVVVVDTSSEPSDAFPGEPSVHYVYRGDIPFSTVSSKNVGLGLAWGDIVAFIDDDCFVSPGWLYSLIPPFRDGDIGLVGGRIIYHPWATPEYSNEIGTMNLSRDQLEGAFHRVSSGVIEVGHLAGGNCAVRRELALTVGGFDPGFSGSQNGEETDFILRVRMLGKKAVFVPDAWVEHRAAPRADGIERTLSNYVYRYSMVRNRLYFLRKHHAGAGVWRSVARHSRDGVVGVVKYAVAASVFLAATCAGLVCGLAATLPNKASGSSIERGD